MKGARILALAAAALIAVNASANAAGRVWFEAAPGTANASVLSQPGSPTLELQCDVSQGLRCDWVITVLYETDGGATGWSLDVGTLAPEDDGKFTIKQLAIIDSALSSPANHNPGALNLPGGLLIEGVGSGNFTGAPASTYQLFQAVLSKNKLPGELNTSFIYAGIGGGEFGGDDPSTGGFYEIVALGPNAPATGFNPGPWGTGYGNPQELPLVIVRNVPEPATLGLIGLGALALIRRRK